LPAFVATGKEARFAGAVTVMVGVVNAYVSTPNSASTPIATSGVAGFSVDGD
jgi:hypothetical protein